VRGRVSGWAAERSTIKKKKQNPWKIGERERETSSALLGKKKD